MGETLRGTSKVIGLSPMEPRMKFTPSTEAFDPSPIGSQNTSRPQYAREMLLGYLNLFLEFR